MSLKEKILLSVIGATLVFAIGGSVWAFAAPKDKPSEQITSQVSEQKQSPEDTSDKQENSSSANEAEDVESSGGVPTASSESSTATTNSPSSPSPTPSSTPRSSTPQKAAPIHEPAQSQPQAVSCNESMKASHKSQYDYQVSAEKADWAQRVRQWSNEASANGMSFSGYVQGKVNANKPAHDARLAQLEKTYRQNLASIHCN